MSLRVNKTLEKLHFFILYIDLRGTGEEMKDSVLLLGFCIPGPEEAKLLFLLLLRKTKRAAHESHGAVQTWPLKMHRSACKSSSSPGEIR